MCPPMNRELWLISLSSSLVRNVLQDRASDLDNGSFPGTMDQEALLEYLSGPLLEIELHDRDRKLTEENIEPALFGDDLEDEKISNVGMVTCECTFVAQNSTPNLRRSSFILFPGRLVRSFPISDLWRQCIRDSVSFIFYHQLISARRTTHNPFSDRSKPWDPYGVARFDLGGLLRGERLIVANIPVQPCRMPDLLGVKDANNNGGEAGKLVGIAGAVDGPSELWFAVQCW